MVDTVRFLGAHVTQVCDFGFPQVTEPSILKELIFQKGYKSELFGDSMVGVGDDGSACKRGMLQECLTLAV